MNATILCPGPSLARLTESDIGPGVVVAVNRAAIRFRCDVWVCLDEPERFMADVLGSPRLVTNQWLAETKGAWRGDMFDYERLAAFFKPKGNQFSATVAMLYAAYTGATDIIVYGADMAGVQDFDGVTLPGQIRDDARWGKEAATWRECTEWLATKGVSVRRL